MKNTRLLPKIGRILILIAFVSLSLQIFPKVSFAEQTTARVFSLQYATASELLNVVEGLLSERGTVAADSRTNSLIVVDTPERMETIARIITQLDTRIPQVMIEATILETNDELLRDLGFEWGRGGRLARFRGASRGREFGFAVDQLQVALDAIESDKRTKLISKTSVRTLNNKPAKIKVAAYTAAAEAVRVTDTSAITSATIVPERVETGSFLVVTPSVHPDDTITLEVEPSLVTPEPSAHYRGRFVDPLARVATTTVIVKDGESIVLGEVESETTTQVEKGLPGLSGFPAFKDEEKRSATRKVVIFLTAKILK